MEEWLHTVTLDRERERESGRIVTVFYESGFSTLFRPKFRGF